MPVFAGRDTIKEFRAKNQKGKDFPTPLPDNGSF